MIASFASTAQQRFDAMSDQERGDTTALCLGIAGYLVHFSLLSWWYIEDAAISFAYARQVALGHGFVGSPGAEWVEGFSNPSWTLALAACDAFGVNPWIAAKLLGALCGAATLPLAVRWFRQVRPEASSQQVLALCAALAFSLQFVLWNSSGLESSVFVLALTASAVWLWEAPRAAASGFAAFILAITRPEAPLYAAVLGFSGLWHHRKQVVPWALRWFAALLIPFGIWHAWRYWAFAWPFPNTYYAKLADAEKFAPWGWQKKGWKYIRNYAFYSGHAALWPAYAAGIVGFAGRERWAVGGSAVLLALAVAIGWVGNTPVYNTISVALVICALGGLTLWLWLKDRGGPRTLAWSLVLVSTFFALYSGGDWMKGYRWFSFSSVPASILLIDGLFALVPLVQRWPRLAKGLPFLPAAFGISASVQFLGAPETMPYDVYRRVLHMENVQRRLHLDHAALLEVDMGAHLWWSEFELIDLAGLVDVPMGHHKWQHPFMREYIFQELQPEFAHVHGNSPRNSLTKLPEWKRYVEVDHYPISPWTVHVGSHIRKDLLQRSWEGPADKTAQFQGSVDLLGVDLPAGTAAGEELFVELALSRPKKGKDFRVWVFLAGPVVTVHELPPAYDWVFPSKWKAKESWVGKYSFPMPENLPVGTYDFGVVIVGTGERAEVWAALETSGTLEFPRVAKGEVRWPKAVEVLLPDEAKRRAQHGLERTIASSNADSCVDAEEAWRISRRWLGRENPWQSTARQSLSEPLANCWARSAKSRLKAEDIRTARRWKWDAAEVLSIGAELADHWEQEAEVASNEEQRYAALAKALMADPTRTWTRKRAEQSRDRRLGLSDKDTVETTNEGGPD